MSSLYFLRHGRADRSAWSGDDRLRPLTEDGRRRLRLQAQAYARMKLGIERIVSSPLTRARETAEIVAAQLGLPVILEPGLAIGCDWEGLVRVLKAHPGRCRLLVGHEPDFSSLIGRLVGAPRGAIVMKKGGLARVDLLTQDSLRGELVWLLPPRLLLIGGEAAEGDV